MASQQSLNMIANPTGGGLSRMGLMYQQAKSTAAEGRRADEKQQMLDTKFKQEQAVAGAKVMGTYATEALDWYDKNPNAPAEQARDYQLELMQKYDPAHQGFIPETLQTRKQLELGQTRSEEILNAFEPKDGLITLIDPVTNQRTSLYKSDRKAVSKLIKEGMIVDSGKATTGVGAVSGYVVDAKGEMITSGILSTKSGLPSKLVDGVNVPLSKGERFVEGKRVTDKSLGFGGDVKVSKANEKWRERVIIGGETAKEVIVQNKAIMQLSNTIQGGSFTELVAKGGNMLQSLFGISPEFISNNDPATVYAQMSLHTDQYLSRSSEKLKGSTSDRDVRVMEIAQGTRPDNPNEAVMFNARRIVAQASEEYQLSKVYDEYVATLDHRPTDNDDSTFRKQYKAMRERSPYSVIHDRTAGHKGFSYKWEYDIRAKNNIDRALAELAPFDPAGGQAELDAYIANRNKIETTLRNNAELQWIKFAAENR